MTQGIQERIEFKLDTLLAAIQSLSGNPVSTDVAQATINEVDTPTDNSADLYVSKWDFSVIDKDGVPADERIHGIVALGDGTKGFKMTTSGFFQKRRNLDDATKAAVVAELKALVALHGAGDTDATTDTGTTPPPPPPQAQSGNTPPPPPPQTAAVPEVDPNEGLKLFIKTIDGFMERTGIDVECLMLYLADTYGYDSFEQLTVPTDRADVIINLQTWESHFNAAKAVKDKICKIYESQPAIINTALQSLFNNNFTYVLKGNETMSNDLTQVTYDDIDSAAGVLENYYNQIGK